jgi:hemoglobin
MKRSLATSLVCAALLLSGQAPAVHGQEQKGVKAPSLYQRVGGFDRLAAMFDDVAPRLATDPQLARFFSGHATDSNLRQRQRLLELLCAETGGPCAYTGRSLKTAHAGLGVGSADWNAFLKHLNASLDHLQFGKQEKAELLSLVERYKADIVEKP